MWNHLNAITSWTIYKFHRPSRSAPGDASAYVDGAASIRSRVLPDLGRKVTQQTAWMLFFFQPKFLAILRLWPFWDGEGQVTLSKVVGDVGDLQLGDKQVTLNHLVVVSLSAILWSQCIFWPRLFARRQIVDDMLQRQRQQLAQATKQMQDTEGFPLKRWRWDDACSNAV